MRFLKIVLFSFLVAIAVAAHAADSSVQQDVLMAKIVALLKAEKPAEALPYFAQLESMESSQSKRVPEIFHFYYIDTLDRTGDKAKAMERANVYVKVFGKSGAHYSEVIGVIGRLEMEVEERAKTDVVREKTKAIIIANMEDVERGEFGDYETNASMFKSQMARYKSLWESYYAKIVRPDIRKLKELLEERNRLEAGSARDQIDAGIRVLNLEIGVLNMRPRKALDSLYAGMEKYSLKNAARDFEKIRLESNCYSKLYIGPVDPSRGKNFYLTFDQATEKVRETLVAFEKEMASSW